MDRFAPLAMAKQQEHQTMTRRIRFASVILGAFTLAPAALAQTFRRARST
jgi:hypothetical protein